MLTQKDQKSIRLKLENIYKIFLSKKEIDYFENEIIQIINHFNKKYFKKKKIISEKTTLIICYGDSVYSERKKSIKIFQNFFQKKFKEYFNTIHFLPFYPSSSDSGFAVKDHFKVENKLGNWKDIKQISKKINIMADIVINHSSARGLWFKNFLKKKEPGKDYFLTVDTKFDTSNVVRPRDHKLLKKIKIFKKSDYLWRTFSPDQIDLNFKNPSVLIQFIKIMIHLIENGVTIFRLDAIAYLWKENKTKCINLKQTHEIIKLLRIIINLLNIQTKIITETNLPEKENLSYFGKNDEANWIYNFSLPPLLIHAFLFENSSHLNKWSKKLPNTKHGNCYLNFIASHDGIGIRPTEGLFDQITLDNFLKRLKKNGSKFSYRKVHNKIKKVYEANITIFDALKKSDNDPKGEFYLERYISAHAIMISFEGIPAIYFNSMFGTSNDEAKFVITGNNRDVNRYRWNFKNITSKLKNDKSKQSIFYQNMCNLLSIRRKQKAFHPNASRQNINLGSNFFSFKRVSIDKDQTIICITNLSSKIQKTHLNKAYLSWNNLIGSKIEIKNKLLILKPFETIWLSNR
ncbi:alpha-amylase family glycosyl hydrolase [Candidatus Pelagibacter communis]|uniref:alpha-amylase family glycosyl hydrolase n=1 Tax=Pelagibacter ubique TaxID=198252 RepID=UPI00094C5B14|nr:alpha-amylase family glycosyl hydrolase [Candidatus Pelagibacter ubique]